jgi:hypothetical protein
MIDLIKNFFNKFSISNSGQIENRCNTHESYSNTTKSYLRQLPKRHPKLDSMDLKINIIFLVGLTFILIWTLGLNGRRFYTVALWRSLRQIKLPNQIN